MIIPLVDLQAQYAAIRQEIDEVIAGVIATGVFVGGEEVHAFNEEFGRFCDAYAVGVGSGTGALYLAARALGLGPGDEVIVPAYTFSGTAEGVALTGAQIVFGDIDEKTKNLDPGAAEAAITENTRAIVAVHLYGQPAEMEALEALAKQHKLFLIEDAAQAHGARYRGRPVGSIGDVGAFSFYPAKNLGAYGDGGAVVSRNRDWVAQVAMLANHGRAGKYLHQIQGTNSRLDSLQAAILRVKLRHLEEWTSRREAIAALYSELLAAYPEVETPVVAEECRHAFHLYVIAVDQRDALRTHLREREIASGIHYPLPLHLQAAYRQLGWGKGSFPNSEMAAQRVLSLPMFPELRESQVRRVVREIGSFLVRKQSVQAGG